MVTQARRLAGNRRAPSGNGRGPAGRQKKGAIKIESEGYEKSEDLLVKDGFVRQIYTKWADGSTATTEDLLTPDKKVYERMTVKGDDIFRYNYAYNQEGKPVGYAKEHTHQGFKRNVEPMTVKMYDGKEVNANDVWSLFEAEPAFDPRVTQK